MHRGTAWGVAALAAAGAVFAVAPGAAQVGRNCAAIAKKSERLACYDAAASGVVAPAPVGGARQPLARGLGAEQVRDRRPESERPEAPSQLLARLVSVSDNGTGHWRMRLSDGSEWEMPQADPYFQPPRRGEVVRVRKGAIGSYLLDVGRQASVKVARIR